MPSLRMSNPFRRGADRASLKQRASKLQATAARVMRRKSPTTAAETVSASITLANGHDVELLAIGVRLDAAVAEWRSFHPTFQRAQELLGAAQDAASPRLSRLSGPALLAALEALEAPYGADLEKGDALAQVCDRLSEEAILHRPATIEGLAVLARAARVRWWDDIDKDRSQLDWPDALAVSLIEGALGLGSSSSHQTTIGRPDPVLAAIAVSHSAEVEIKAWSASVRGRMTSALFREEDRLNEIQVQARDAAFSTVPTTRAGQIALVEYIRFQMDLYGMLDGDPPEDGSPIWRDAHHALMAALAAPVMASPKVAAPDLSAAPLRKLVHLHGAVESLWRHASGELQAPWCMDAESETFNVAGKALEAESDRFASLLDAIANEARQRGAASDAERDDILAIRLRHELVAGGFVEDPDLKADLVVAWRA